MSENTRDDARTPDPGHEPAEPQETQVVETSGATRVPDASGDTQVLETTGDTQVLDASGGTRVLETGDTQALPHGGTRVLPTPGGARDEATTAPVAAPEHDDEPEVQRTDVPLAVFDEPGPAPQGPAPQGPAAQGPGALRSDVPPAAPYPAPYPAPYAAPSPGAHPAGYPAERGAGYPTGPAGPSGNPPYPPYQPYGQSAGPGPQPAPYAPAEPLPAPPVSTAVRTGTIVWGLVILAVGLALVAVAAGARFDVGLGLIWLLGGAGLVLVVASVVGGVRRRNRADT